MAQGQALFNDGLFFECHEFLEEAWREARGDERLLLQGLIQIAAGFHKFKIQPRSTGPVELIEKGLAKVRASGALGEEREKALAAALETVLASLRAGRFSLQAAPRLAIVGKT